MRIVRFEHNQTAAYGVLSDDIVKELNGLPYEKLTWSGREYPLNTVRLLAPTEPRSIVAVGLNYMQHAREMSMGQVREPLLFAKPVSAVIGPGAHIIKPDVCTRLDYEAELAVVIGKSCHNVDVQQAKDAIFGYTCLNDVTARDIQNRESQWLHAKGFYTFCPFGPWVETELDVADIGIKAVLNGKTVQDDRTSNMMFGVPFLISYISSFMELHAGDVVATGTPGGIGPMASGDEIKIVIEGIGELVNHVK